VVIQSVLRLSVIPGLGVIFRSRRTKK